MLHVPNFEHLVSCSVLPFKQNFKGPILLVLPLVECIYHQLWLHECAMKHVCGTHGARSFGTGPQPQEDDSLEPPVVNFIGSQIK